MTRCNHQGKESVLTDSSTVTTGGGVGVMQNSCISNYHLQILAFLIMKQKTFYYPDLRNKDLIKITF